MRKTLVALALIGFAFVGVRAFAEDKAQSYTGAIIDTACGAKNNTEEKAVAHGKECTIKCGSKDTGKLVLMSGEKSIKIADASKDKVLAYLKKDDTKDTKVIIMGTVKDDALTVDEIKPAAEKKG